MKNLAAILVLGWALTHAATAEVPATFVKLIGLSTVPGARCAFLIVFEAQRPVLGEVVLAEGKTAGGLELVTIDDQTMTATIRQNGKESVLGFTAEGLTPPLPRSKTSSLGKNTGTIKFQNLNISRLLEFYSQLTARTMLQSSAISGQVISGQGQCAGRDEVVRFLERSMARARLQILPQGEKFAVVLPAELALPASALWKARKKTAAANPGNAAPAVGTVNFQNADLSQVLQFYGALAGRKVESDPGLSPIPITIRSQTELTQPEMLYALETVLVLNGIQMETTPDQTVKAVPAAIPVSNPVPVAKIKSPLSK